MAYCEKCGKETKEGQIFCDDCLAELESNSFDDLFDSLNEKTEMNEADDDFTKILEELQGSQEETKKDTASQSSTVSDVFSDAVSAISSLDDELESMLNQEISEKPEKKKGFFARLFGRKSKKEETSSNEVEKKDLKKEKKAKKQAEKEKKKQEKLEAAKEKEAKAKKAAEEKKAAKEEKKKDASKKKDKKDNKVKEAKEKKLKKKKAKEKKPKKEKVEEANPEVVEEIEEDLGHFNIPVMIMVFILFAGGIGFLMIRSSAASYNYSIEVAENKFQKQHYNEAFEEIYGLDIKKDDTELYDKIMTVMYVNKQLNSYNNYKELELYPEALDSLIKGLKRYDAYIDSAKELGIQDDLDYVRGQILKVLKKQFGVSKKKAESLMAIESQTEYSLEIYDIVHKKLDVTKKKLAQ